MIERPARAFAAPLALVLLPALARTQDTAPIAASTSAPSQQSVSQGPADARPAKGSDQAARSAPELDDSAQDAVLGADDARTSISKGLRFLLSKQNEDGSWGTSTVESLHEIHYSNASFYAWKIAGGALALRAMLAADETPELRAKLERGVRYLVDAERPRRGNHWDVDSNWAVLYVFDLLTALARDPRFAGEPWSSKIAARGKEYATALEELQDPLGGWGYYEGPVLSRRPTWSTSFATAGVIPALVAARELGFPVGAPYVERAVRYVERCRLPNGAYEYDLKPVPRVGVGESINTVKGSLGRMQVCNWALRAAGVARITDDEIRAGLTAFFADHRFLDVARMKPVPHEAYYANAGYFYFYGHYYAARAIECLPAAEREAWHARLRPHLVKAQGADGSSVDFPGSFYVYTASTAFSVLGLQLGVRGGEAVR